MCATTIAKRVEQNQHTSTIYRKGLPQVLQEVKMAGFVLATVIRFEHAYQEETEKLYIQYQEGEHMEPIIVQARVRDAEAILKLQYLCYQTQAALYNNYTLDPLTESLTDLLFKYDTHGILVARLG